MPNPNSRTIRQGPTAPSVGVRIVRRSVATKERGFRTDVAKPLFGYAGESVPAVTIRHADRANAAESVPIHAIWRVFKVFNAVDVVLTAIGPRTLAVCDWVPATDAEGQADKECRTLKRLEHHGSLRTFARREVAVIGKLKPAMARRMTLCIDAFGSLGGASLRLRRALCPRAPAIAVGSAP